MTDDQYNELIKRLDEIIALLKDLMMSADPGEGELFGVTYKDWLNRQ